MSRRCPDCNRPMKAVTSRDPDRSYECEHCASFWNSVCDRCLSRDCWLEHRNKDCVAREWPDTGDSGRMD